MVRTVRAKARTYLRCKYNGKSKCKSRSLRDDKQRGHGKDNYRDSGFARMTAVGGWMTVPGGANDGGGWDE